MGTVWLRDTEKIKGGNYMHPPFHGHMIRPIWTMPQDKVEYLDYDILVHPYTYCRMVLMWQGTDKAMDLFKKYVHERINKAFAELKEREH